MANQPIDMRSLLETQRMASAAGQRGEKPTLLSDADMNIGNELRIVSPPPLPVVRTPSTSPARILNLNAASKSGQMVTVGIGARAASSPDLATTLFPSNFITGVAEFGNGARSTLVEFDIPLGPTSLVSTANPIPVAPEDGGVMISLPSGTLRVYARSDTNLVAGTIDGSVAGGNIANLSPPAELGATDIIVYAFAGYFTRPSVFPPTKTLWLGEVSAIGGVNFIGATYAIPAFARTIRILKPAAPAIEIVLRDIRQNELDRFTIGAGTRSATFPLPGQAACFAFGAATTNPITVGSIIQAVFELGI
jgi:hypothetical protein